MVFVHSRNGTLKTATALRDLAQSYGQLALFQPEQGPRLGLAEKQVNYAFAQNRAILVAVHIMIDYGNCCVLMAITLVSVGPIL